METPAQRLKYVRKLRKMNQMQLAVAAGVATGTVGNIEAGARKIDGSALKLAKALRVDPNWLASGDGETPGQAMSTSRPEQPSAPITLAQALEAIGTTLLHIDQTARRRAGALLADLADDPAAHETLAVVLTAVIKAGKRQEV